MNYNNKVLFVFGTKIENSSLSGSSNMFVKYSTLKEGCLSMIKYPSEFDVANRYDSYKCRTWSGEKVRGSSCNFLPYFDPSSKQCIQKIYRNCKSIHENV